MRKQWDTIEVLRHARHDWLNKLQLIKGNLDLNKMDRVKEIINEIVLETQQEAKLSNLNLPQFSSLLLTSNWDSYHFTLEFEVMDSPNTHNEGDQKLARWTRGLFEELHTSIEAFQENHLFVTVEPQDKGIRFFFDFSGIIIDKERVESFLKESHVENMSVNIEVLDGNELALEVFMHAC
ncbi:Spo0B C-terminal domain-containing protein [Mesobacillus harenae]|uniref:Spo0B C-terminal domain-containing protein n=1 Tax=Mesobacillus harenae TaxID=2213203 RepID=UPI001580E18F|nr:Spo0B C-terminal domain-containing protein [Mesobacillus harenae]